MKKEFSVKKFKEATVYTLESASGGGTSSGAVASVSMPMGGVRKRGDNLIAQEDNKDKIPATTPRNFVAKNAKTGGAGAHKDKKKAEKQGDVKHKKPYAESLQEKLNALLSEDHSTAADGWGKGSYDAYAGGRHDRGVAENPEWYNDEANDMSSAQLKSLVKHAAKLRQAVKAMQSQGDTLEPWQQSKVTKAADYLDAVFNAVDSEHDMGEEEMAEVAPKGWEPTVKAMKKHKEIDNPYALSNWMKNKGYKSHQKEDAYMQELQAKLDEKIPADAPVDVWVNDFQKADPNKYHQFKNKTPEKKTQMAQAASYAAKNPNKK